MAAKVYKGYNNNQYIVNNSPIDDEDSCVYGLVLIPKKKDRDIFVFDITDDELQMQRGRIVITFKKQDNVWELDSKEMVTLEYDTYFRYLLDESGNCVLADDHITSLVSGVILETSDLREQMLE